MFRFNNYTESSHSLLLFVALSIPITIRQTYLAIQLLILTFFLDLKTRPSRPPVPLFGGDHSYVDDYYTGDIYSAFEEADNHENAFIMFYSPWDADCLRAVQVFEAVAKKFVDMDLYVAAVNCWEPNGDCHREFGGNTKSARGRKLAPSMSMPVLVFYPKNRKGIQYHG